MSRRGLSSFSRLLDKLEAAPNSVAVLSDCQLALLASRLPLFPARAALILGEVLFRRWLYEDRSPAEIKGIARTRIPAALNEECEKLAFQRRAVLDQEGLLGAFEPLVHSSQEMGNLIWGFFCQRVRDCLAADGFFPLAVGQDEGAVLVPFQFRALETKAGKVRDKSGRALRKWSSAVASLEKETDCELSIELMIELGSREGNIDGSSFGLALLIAKERKRGYQMGEFQPLEILASGAFINGRLAEVGKSDAKKDLAWRMDAKLFVSPGVERTDDSCLYLPVGASIPDCINVIEAELSKRGLTKLDYHRAMGGLTKLDKQLRKSLITSDEAEAKLRRYESAFRSSSHQAAGDGLKQCILLLAAVANHRGEPLKALSAEDQVSLAELAHGDPLLYTKAIAFQVVSLTDLRSLEKAEQLARGLLSWIDQEFRGSHETELRCRMIACGALGGQPLLTLGLQNPHRADESLNFLQMALEHAIELNDPREIAMDLAQISLGHALLKPESFREQCAHAEDQIRTLPGQAALVSIQHLRRARLLGAFRQLLREAELPPDFDAWPLPDCQVPWLFASALKYRGALFAATGEAKRALQDFTQAYGLLDRVSHPLIRFIGATAALQAGESLWPVRRKEAREFFHQAKASFAPFASYFHEPGWVEKWRQRCDGFLLGRNAEKLPHPQQEFVY